MSLFLFLLIIFNIFANFSFTSFKTGMELFVVYIFIYIYSGENLENKEIKK